MVNPKSYLEIGVRNGQSISLAGDDTCAYGIDPAPDINIPLCEKVTIFACTSDDFFERFDMKKELKLPLDLCLLDGTQLFEFGLRDFINSEALCSKNSLIAVHNTYPQNAITSVGERTTQELCGDIFKLLLALKKYRPELDTLHLDSKPSGLLLVKNLNPSSTVLRDNYATILDEFSTIDFSEIEKGKGQILSAVPLKKESLKQFIGTPSNTIAVKKEVTPAGASAANYFFTKSSPKGSIKTLGVLLCYNDGDFLAESIEHLLSQNHHVIAWDHGSSDETSAILDRYQSHLLERRYIPRDIDFYTLYPLMSRHIMKNHAKTYDVVSWPDQDEILEGPFRDKSYYEYLVEFYHSPFTWLRFNNMNFWHSKNDGNEVKTTDRVKHYSIFADCAPRIRAWKAKATNIRQFNHNPLAEGVECPVLFNLRHYPFRTAEQMKRRIEIDRANIQRGTANYHYNAMKEKYTYITSFDASKELHFDDGKELSRKEIFNWRKIY